jgi:hypothetical protein
LTIPKSTSEITTDAIDITANLDNDNTTAVVANISSEITANATDFVILL